MSYCDNAAESTAFSPPPRNLTAELAAVEAWLLVHPSASANAISKEAGLNRNSLSNLLREDTTEKPSETRLDKLYGSLRRYGFAPQGPGLPPALSLEAVATLLDLHTQGYVLLCANSTQWRVVQLAGEGMLTVAVATGATPAEAIERAGRYLSSEQ